MQKRFTKINENFVCEVCGHENLKHVSTCRDHCVKCLSSKHVDKNPGDRAESCHGVLEPVDILVKGGVPYKIVYKCKKCGMERRNIIMDDDDREAIFSVMERKAFR